MKLNTLLASKLSTAVQRTGALLVFSLGTNVLMSQNATAQKVGFEKEYATIGFMDSAWGEQHLEASRKLLEVVKSNFGGYGSIEKELWAKYPEKNLQYLFYRDHQGRKWRVDPESVNTSGLDGLEFVLPPLESDAELKIAQKILSDIKKTKTVMRGLRSSGHITIDVSHLTGDKNNMSELVDLILTIENHWSEIYRFFDPVRYGTIVNRFSVPLASDQQALLKDLADLPKNQRSYENIKKVFLRYDELENQLRNSDGKNEGRKWKYRAANYAKIFELMQGGFAPVIEFRIPDLDFGDKMEGYVKFLRNLVNLKQKDTEFKFPFGKEALGWKKATEVIRLSKANSEFTQKLGVDHLKDFSQNTNLNPDIELVDIMRPIHGSKEYITYGFEAEFRGERAHTLLNIDKQSRSEKNYSLRSDAYNFLDSEVDKEDSGNYEVRSLGGEIHLSETLEQMKLIRSKLKQDLRGFHLHIRIPKEIIEKHDKSRLLSWMNYTSDIVFSWRLQNKKHFLSLQSDTLGRINISDLASGARGPVRAQYLKDGSLDFEIRGLMSNIDLIGSVTQKFLTGIMNPDYLRNDTFSQYKLSFKSKHLTETIEDFLEQTQKRKLTDAEKEVLTSLEKEITSAGSLPLYRFDQMTGLDVYEKQRIRDANFEFYKETMTVVKNRINGKYADRRETGKQFRWRVQRWAQKIDLQNILERHLFDTVTPSQSNAVMLDRMIKSNSYYKNSLLGQFKRLDFSGESKILKIIDFDLESPYKETRINAARLLRQYEESPLALQIIKKALNDVDHVVRAHALHSLANHSSDEAFEIMKGFLNSTNQGEVEAALRGMTKYKTPEALSIFESTLENSYSSSAKELAVGAILNSDRIDKLQFIEKHIAGSNTELKIILATHLLTESSEPALKLVKKFLNDDSWKVRLVAVKALENYHNDEALKLLVTAAKDDNRDIRSEAFEKMKKYNSEDYFQIAEQLLDPDLDLKNRLTGILAVQGKKEEAVLKVLEIGLKDEAPEVREIALANLRSLIESPLKEKIQSSTSFKKALQLPLNQLEKRQIISEKGSLNLKYQSPTKLSCSKLF